jgi:hypothetical protein
MYILQVVVAAAEQVVVSAAQVVLVGVEQAPQVLAPEQMELQAQAEEAEELHTQQDPHMGATAVKV